MEPVTAGSEAQSAPSATVAHQEVFPRWCLFSNPGGIRGIGLSRGIGRAPEWLAIPRTPCLVWGQSQLGAPGAQ